MFSIVSNRAVPSVTSFIDSSERVSQPMSALDAAVFSIARAISPAMSVLSNARASARDDASSAADATRNETPGASSDTTARVSRLVHSAKGLFVEDDDDDVGDDDGDGDDVGGGEDAPGDEPRGDKKSSKKDKKDKKDKRASGGDEEPAKKPRTGDDADYSNVAPPKSVDTKTKPQLTWLQQQRQLQHKERQANRGHKHKLGAKARKRARAREAKAAATSGGGGE